MLKVGTNTVKPVGIERAVIGMHTDTASGAVANFSTNVAAPAKSVLVNIEPVQDLHGYDHPWPAGGGVNKCDMSIVSVATPQAAYGLTVTKNENDGTITCQGTPSWTSTGIGRTFRLFYYTDAYNNGYKFWFTVVSKSSNISDLTWVEAIGSDNSAVVRVTVSDLNDVSFTIKPVLYTGSTAPTAWSPYSNICPITGWTGANVTRTGKNLDPYSDFGSTTRLWGSNSNDQKNVFSSLPVGTYTMSCKFKVLTNPNDEANVQIGVLARYSNGVGGYVNIIPYSLTTKAATVGAVYDWSYTFTLTESLADKDSLYVYFYCADNGTSAVTANAYDIQIEAGSTPTAYEPYTGDTYSIDWQTEAGTVYGGSLDVTTGVLTVDRAMVDLGTLSWSGDPNRSSVFYAAVNKKSNPQHVVCSCYKELYAGVTTDEDKYISGWNSYGNGLYIRDTDFAGYTRAQVQSALSGQTVVYPVATPLTYQLTPQEVKTLLGQNNIWADTGDTSVTYWDGDVVYEKTV